jgi:hypothetical protein
VAAAITTVVVLGASGRGMLDRFVSCRRLAWLRAGGRPLFPSRLIRVFARSASSSKSLRPESISRLK